LINGDRITVRKEVLFFSAALVLKNNYSLLRLYNIDPKRLRRFKPLTTWCVQIILKNLRFYFVPHFLGGTTITWGTK
jgi:hypothetical protein